VISNDLILPTVAVGRLATEHRLQTRSRARGARALAPSALAGVSGSGFAAAFPPLSWTVAAWVSLAPLLVACAALSPLRAALAALCWTAAAAVGVASFLPAMLSGYFGLAAVPSWIAALAIAACR
jgi:apolipoprotein N-acyltransferase